MTRKLLVVLAGLFILSGCADHSEEGDRSSEPEEVDSNLEEKSESTKSQMP